MEPDTGIPPPAVATSTATSTTDLDVALRGALSGSQQNFVLVYRAVQPGLLRYLRVLVGADAEDVASEAWAQACRDLHRFSGDGNGFKGWLATIGRNRALDHLRARSRRPAHPVAPETLIDLADAADTAGQAVDAIATSDAIALIASLPPDQAEAVLLRVVMGLNAKAAAEVLGKRPGAVRTSAYRGLKTLATKVERSRSW